MRIDVIQQRPKFHARSCEIEDRRKSQFRFLMVFQAMNFGEVMRTNQEASLLPKRWTLEEFQNVCKLGGDARRWPEVASISDGGGSVVWTVAVVVQDRVGFLWFARYITLGSAEIWYFFSFGWIAVPDGAELVWCEDCRTRKLQFDGCSVFVFVIHLAST